jgi:hypothetical protein
MKLDICAFHENLSRKFKFYSNPTKITGTLHEDIVTFLTKPRWIQFRMGNALDQSRKENQNTYFMVKYFFFFENRIFYEIMSKNCVENEAPEMTSQYGSYAFHAGLARLDALMRMLMLTRPRPRTHMHALTHKHAHTYQ